MELVYLGPDGIISQLQELPVFRIDVGDDSEQNSLRQRQGGCALGNIGGYHRFPTDGT